MRLDIGSYSSGITIEYIKSRKVINISGHYDSMVGIEGDCFSLVDFCRKLGIDAKALKQTIIELSKED